MGADKMLTKIYLETTNICNLDCSFCHKTSRKAHTMSLDEFKIIADKIRGKSKLLYLHLMGEPLINPNLPQMARYAKEIGFDVMVTTNGTMLSEKGEFLYESGNVKKVSISLQALDKNNTIDFEKYLKDVCDFAIKCAKHGVICALRLWNLYDGQNDENEDVLNFLHNYFPDEWIKSRSSFKLCNSPLNQNNIYLEFGEHFEWPDIDGKVYDVKSCRGIRDQIGILCDGTVVPCCLDAEGSINLGNIFENSLDEILDSPRTKNILASFMQKRPCEELCKRCGFATRFK